jgi:RNA polymerase sigma factor (sigma-70 family)
MAEVALLHANCIRFANRTYPVGSLARFISIVATAAPEIPVLARDQAFESLYRAYVKDVYRYALALLRNPADAEDVTQATFLNAYRAYLNGIEVEKPQNWLIKIAHNVARTRYARASRRVKEVPLEDHVEQLAVPEDDRPDVAGVLKALGRLPFNQRAALVMRELEGRSYAEISDTIGVSVSAVETLIFRARRSLRLKASALRSLAVVPLPNSLAQLFDTGGLVAAGGGAVAGGGLLLKVAVALVAGALATGITSDHSRPAAAASDSNGHVAAPAWRLANAFRTAGLPALSGGRAADAQAVRRATKRLAIGSRRSRQVGVVARARPEAVRGTRTELIPTSRQSGPTSPVSTVTEQAVSVAGAAQTAVEASIAALPVTLPVKVPAVTLPPVEVPQLPGGTPLP